MNWLRIYHVIKFGWGHAGQIAKDEGKGFVYRLRIYTDILRCYNRWYLFSNVYYREKFYKLTEEERERIAQPYYLKEKHEKEWWADYNETRRFLTKWMSHKYDTIKGTRKRNKAYANRFCTGSNLWVEYGVELIRQHELDGTVKIGNNVLFARDCCIDFSGGIFIGNEVHFSHGVYVITHEHEYFEVCDGKYKRASKVEQKPLIIEDYVHIGEGVKILASCNKIGRYARIGAGAVIRTDVPPYAIMLGNPAKIVGFCMKPVDALQLENEYPENERYSLEQLTKNYQKYYISRLKEIAEFIKI